MNKISMNFFRTQFSADLSAILMGAMFNAIPVLVLFFYSEPLLPRERQLLGPGRAVR
jgi:hypothetical protein